MRDIRHAARRLLRDWPFTTAAILILGLGIGINTAAFSVINAALFRAQSAANPDRMVDIYQRGINADGIDANSYPAYLDMAAHTDVFASTTAVSVPIGAPFADGTALRPATVEHTTSSYLTTLGLRPSLGRWFDAAEDAGGAAVAGVVSHHAWLRKFGGDPSIVGRSVRIGGVPVTIVGVGPAGHRATLNAGVGTDFWLPIAAMRRLGAPPRALERKPGEAAFLVKARLRDGVTLAQAQAAMDSLGTRLAAEYPKDDPGKGIAVFASSDVRIHPQLDALMKPVAAVLLGLVGVVLAIACSNLATLLLVRGAARAKEVSIRLALGATRRQLVVHLLTESVLLSVAAGLVACVLAWWGIRSVNAIALPVGIDLRLDYRVLLFAIVVSLVTGVAFGLAPAFNATRVELVPSLSGAGDVGSPDRRWLTLKNALVVFQVAVSVALLGGTSIFLQMLSASRATHVGFAVDGVAMLELAPQYAGRSAADAARIAEETRRRVAAIPGVQSAALIRGLPMQANGARIVVDGAAPDRTLPAGAVWAAPGFFETLRIPVMYGRPIDDRDRPGAPRAAVINETMARQYFGVADATGRRFRIAEETDSWFQVVGVVPDTGTADLSGDLVDPTPQLFFRSVTQADTPATTVLARTSFDALALVAAAQREARAVDAAVPVTTARTMAQGLEESLVAPKAIVALLAALAGLGLTLAGVGLYAVVAFAVSRRAREIGIRMALGAQGRQVVWTVSRQVAALVAIGTGAGLLLSVSITLALRAASAPAVGVRLYRPSPDPIALTAIAVFMSAIAMAAGSMPAWRAARIDPFAALRRD